jgi:hypothetical protein
VRAYQFFKISILIVFITQFTQFAYASGVRVSWAENSVSTVAGYKVYYGTASRNYQTNVDAGTFTSVVIDGLSAGITYYFAVTAYNYSGNESAYSQEVHATIPNTPVISCATTSLTNSCAKGNNASSQSLQVWNSGTGTLNYNVSTNQSWITCAQPSGSSTGVSDKKTLTFNYSTSNLALGIYTATITISASGASNTPQTILVTLTVLPPTIAFSPTSITNTCAVGNNAASQTFQVWNAGAGTLNYTISTNQSWLSCTSSGTSTGPTDRKTVTVFYTASKLTQGTYAATITITAPGASNTPQTIPMTLTVTPPPAPTISNNVSSTVTASCTQGSSPSGQTFDIWNSGGGTLTYRISTNQSWLSCTPSNGTSVATSGGSGHNTITVNYAASSLTPGSYSATITISASGAANTPQKILVNLTVNPVANVTPPAAPTISENAPSAINTTCVKGSNASSQTFQVWNSGGGTLTYSVYGNVSWLSCTPSSGTSTGGRGTITVNFATSSLAAGSYPATITISASGASNSPQTLPVSLTVNALSPTPTPSPSPTPSPTPNPSPTTSPEELTILLTPTTFSLSCAQGTDAADQSFQIGNSGKGTLNYSITTDADWITISPSSSSTLAGDNTMITIHFKTADLAVGEYDNTITITSHDEGVTNSPQTIPVNMSVKGAEAESKSGGGDRGGGCFILTSVSDSPNPLIPFFTFLGIGLICIARFCRIFVGK